MKRTSAIFFLPGLALATFQAVVGCGSECEDTDSCAPYTPPGGSAGTSGGTAGKGGTSGGTSGSSGATGGGTAGDGGAGGTSGEAGGGGAGGAEPCNGACTPPTPVCLEATDTCVECTQPSHCQAPTPACDTDENVCVECLESSDCSAPTPVCDQEEQECVECLASADCTEPTASRCDATNDCVPCTANADCAHLSDRNVCDNGTCVQCTVANESACGANSCNPATKACTATPRGSVSVCLPCLADSECMGGNQADPDVRCVPMEFEGTQRPGGFCLRRVAKTCERPYSIVISKTSLSGVEQEGYCGIDQANVRCEAVLDLLRARTCPLLADEECGCARDGDGNCVATGEGGVCRTVGPNLNRCTYQCGTDDDCPTGRTCGGTLPPHCQ